MYQDLQKHRKSDAIKWIAVLIAVVLLAVSVSAALTNGFTNGNPYGWFDEKTDEENEKNAEGSESTPDVSSEISNHVFLAVGDAVASADGATVSRTLMATILPADAPDKSVDWTVYWIVNPFDASAVVTDYITVVPTSDGSLTADVIAHQGFEDATIGVRVTTRVGSFSAICEVTYDGRPENLIITYNGTGYSDSDTSLSGTHLDLVAGTTYTMDIGLTNTLGAVGSKYGTYEVSVNGSGNFMATKKTSARGQTTTYEEVSISVDDYVSSFVTASLVDGQLQIVVKQSISSFYMLNAGNNGATEWYYSGPHANPNATPCFYIIVHETVSSTGISNYLYFDITATVTSVSLSSSSLTF